MNRKIKKELMEDIRKFLDNIEFYVDDCNEYKMTKIIVENELKRFFKKYE